MSGPATGGQNNRGAFVTIYGNNFGSTRGTSTVTVGGGAVASYPVWTNTKITVQLGSAAATGNVVVNVNGSLSNAVPFTVRSGRIFFVATSGSDGNSGSYSSPWATLTKGRSVVQPGDIVYVRTGVQQTGADLSSASLTLSTSGTSTAPIAFVAYPNATVTIGSATGQTYGVRTAPNNSVKWIVIAGMKILGAVTAVDFPSGYNWRLVGNDISCPNASGTAACVSGPNSGGSKVYGNNIHDAGYSAASSLVQYEAVNLASTTSLDFGWNEIGRVQGCDALTVGGSSAGNYNLKIHDNFIHDVRCNGVTVGKVDTSKGAVRVYNNLLVRTGKGPAPAGVESYSYTGVSARANSIGTISVTNNTFHDCGARKNANSGCIKADSTTSLVDNIFYVTTGEYYIAAGSTSGMVSGSHNLFYGAGSGPSVFTSSVSGSPAFLYPSGNDFRLGSGSAAIDKGKTTTVKTDLAGTTRPKGAAFDIGAYEYPGTNPSPTPSGTLAANPTSVSFGQVATGTTSTKTVTLSNSGSANLTISAISVSGSGFSASGITVPLTLVPGGTATLTLRCTPTAAASYYGTATVSSNASNASFSIPLSGTGTATSTLHYVDLTWTASTSSGVTGYNVYRSTTSGSSYTKINSSQVAATSYRDPNVSSGITYYYVVRAVNSSGMESSNSTQVSARIP